MDLCQVDTCPNHGLEAEHWMNLRTTNLSLPTFGTVR
jgi:hypothetical protein